MPLFRKKPVVVEAINLAQIQSLPWHFETAVLNTEIELLPEGGALVHTIEGTMEAQPGDWLIRGVKGEFYPCKPDVFDQTYEEVSAEADALKTEFEEAHQVKEDPVAHMRENLRHIHDLIDANFVQTDGEHRLRLHGEIHTGPVVDWTIAFIGTLLRTMKLLLSKNGDQLKPPPQH